MPRAPPTGISNAIYLTVGTLPTPPPKKKPPGYSTQNITTLALNSYRICTYVYGYDYRY